MGTITRNFETAYNELVSSENNYNGLSATIHSALNGLHGMFEDVVDWLEQFTAVTEDIESTFDLRTQAKTAFAEINATHAWTYAQAQDSMQVYIL